MPNTVLLRKFVQVRDEAIADGSITPGHLVELTSAEKVKVHATAGGNVNGKFFAFEDELQGDGIDDAYATGTKVQYDQYLPGDRVNALLADGETVVVGDALMSAGDGTLKKYVAQAETSAGSVTINPNMIVGIAKAALDLSGSSAADPASARLAVQIV